MEKPPDLAVGEAVFYAREQAVGIIYETYSFVDGPGARPGVSLLLSDGRNLGGFNAQEADRFLLLLGPTDLDYRFTDVGQLAADYGRGLFAKPFTAPRYCTFQKRWPAPQPEASSFSPFVPFDMGPTRQNAPNTPVFASQLAYLAVERLAADETEAQRLGQLRQLIQAARDVANLRDFATPARELMGEGTPSTAAAATSG